MMFQGPTCRYVYTPPSWDIRPQHAKNTVILNIWSNHVFTYDRAVAHTTFTAKERPVHYELRLAPLRERKGRMRIW